MELSPKKLREMKTAEIFLGLYNDQMRTSFEIIEFSDPPDIICQDMISREKLELEISYLQDLFGQIAYLLGKAPLPISPSTNTTVYTFEDIVDTYKFYLNKKLQSFYGKNTALVLESVTAYMGPKEWKDIQIRINDVLIGKEENYGTGIWVICTDTDTFPAKPTLFCLCIPRN